MIFISALNGQRVSKLFPLIHEVADAHARRIGTGRLNQFLRDCVDRMSPPAVDGKLPKLYFMTQVGTRPPSFVISTNTDREIHFSYQRYLENRLREEFGFTGTPIRLAFRKRAKGESSGEGVARVRRILDPGEGLKPSRRKEGRTDTSKEGSSPRPKAPAGGGTAARGGPAPARSGKAPARSGKATARRPVRKRG
jgi:GTP-binding protein